SIAEADRDGESQEMGRRVLTLLAELDCGLALGPAELLLQFAGELRFSAAHRRPVFAALLIDPEFLKRRVHRLQQVRDRLFRSQLENADGRRSVIGNLVSRGKLDWIWTIQVKQDDAEQMSKKNAAE